MMNNPYNFLLAHRSKLIHYITLLTGIVLSSIVLLTISSAETQEVPDKTVTVRPVLEVLPSPPLPRDVLNLSVAVVNIRRLMEEAPQAAIERAILRERFNDIEERIEKEAIQIRELEISLKQEITPLTEAERLSLEREARSLRRKHLRGKEDYVEDQRIAQMAALEKVQTAVFDAIKKVREQEKIDIILNDFVSASERVDITPRVYRYLEEVLQAEQETAKESENNQ